MPRNRTNQGESVYSENFVEDDLACDDEFDGSVIDTGASAIDALTICDEMGMPSSMESVEMTHTFFGNLQAEGTNITSSIDGRVWNRILGVNDTIAHVNDATTDLAEAVKDATSEESGAVEASGMVGVAAGSSKKMNKGSRMGRSKAPIRGKASATVDGYDGGVTVQRITLLEATNDYPTDMGIKMTGLASRSKDTFQHNMSHQDLTEEGQVVDVLISTGKTDFTNRRQEDGHIIYDIADHVPHPTQNFRAMFPEFSAETIGSRGTFKQEDILLEGGMQTGSKSVRIIGADGPVANIMKNDLASFPEYEDQLALGPVGMMYGQEYHEIPTKVFNSVVADLKEEVYGSKRKPITSARNFGFSASRSDGRKLKDMTNISSGISSAHLKGSELLAKPSKITMKMRIDFTRAAV